MKKLFSFVLVLVFAVALTGCGNDSGGGGAESSGGSSSDSGQSYTIADVKEEPDWEEIPQIDIDHQQWVEPVDITAHAQLCYSDDALFVHMWAEEKNIRAEYSKSDVLGHTYEDSCLEFFFLPVSGDARYMNFEYNPNGCVCVQIGKTKQDRIRIAFEEDILEAVPNRIEGGWEIKYKIPFDFLENLYPDFKAESGEQIAGNFYKCGDQTVQKHYLTWNPVDSQKPNFHCPESFGTLIFE